jgi:hypothetical protein
LPSGKAQAIFSFCFGKPVRESLVPTSLRAVHGGLEIFAERADNGFVIRQQVGEHLPGSVAQLLLEPRALREIERAERVCTH